MAKEGEKELGIEMTGQLRVTEGKERQRGIMKPEKLKKPEKPDRPDCSGPDPCCLKGMVIGLWV